jgi:L-fuculose-phosphate aldolase
MLLGNLREQIVEIGMRMVADGLAHGTQGNISALDTGSGLLAVTPSAVPYAQRRAEDICVLDPQQRVIEGRWQPTSEIKLHLAIFRRRNDVRAVVHSHALNASVFGVTGEAIPQVLIESALCLTGPVPVAGYAPPGGEAVAELTAEALGVYGNAAVMAHHGLVTVGDTLDHAYAASLAAETMAKVVILTRSMGVKERTLDLLEAAFIPLPSITTRKHGCSRASSPRALAAGRRLPA